MSKSKTYPETAEHAPPAPTVESERPTPDKDDAPMRVAQTGAGGRAQTMIQRQQTIGNTRSANTLLQRQPRGGGGATATPAAPSVGTRFTHPTGSRSPHRAITGEFDGREFILKGDGVQLMRVEAVSGRPITVDAGDARACGGSPDDSYKNNPLYVGITDNGPIPEGEFHVRATDFATFTAAEQRQFTLGGHFTDPFGAPMHGGDWGAGRAPLRPVRVVPAARGCGNTGRRSGFFIHGGVLSGSSGCIDVGNTGITDLLTHLAGYRGTIVVTVRYRHPPPSVGRLERVLGGGIYPGQRDPSVQDRIGGALRELFRRDGGN